MDDYIIVPELTTRANSSWTVSIWVNPSTQSNDNVVVTKMGSADGALNYQLGLDENGHLICKAGNNIGRTYQSMSTRTVAVGKWTHLVCVSDGVSINGWIDDVQDGMAKFEGQVCVNCLVGSPGPLTIGHSGPQSGCAQCAARYFEGAMEDLQIYNRPLNGTLITDLYYWNMPHY